VSFHSTPHDLRFEVGGDECHASCRATGASLLDCPPNHPNGSRDGKPYAEGAAGGAPRFRLWVASFTAMSRMHDPSEPHLSPLQIGVWAESVAVDMPPPFAAAVELVHPVSLS